MPRSSTVLLLLPLLLPLGACNQEKPESTSEQAETGSPEAGSMATGTPGDTPIGPISSRGGTIDGGGAPAGSADMGAGLDFDLPAGWQSEPPSSDMRLAQATIPGPAGNGQLAVFFFGPGGGGTVEANIERWVGQMEVSGAAPQPQVFEANGYRVTWIDVAGTLQPSTMGMGPSEPQPGARLLGAVVEGPGGPWFFKATGPDATLAGQREAFLTMLRSVRGA
jgi:hypothetical protein